MSKRKAITLLQLQNLCKRNGYFFKPPEDGFYPSNSYIYGPLGTELKRNFLQEWWSSVVTEKEHVEGISTPQIKISSKKYPVSQGDLPIEVKSSKQAGNSRRKFYLRNSLTSNIFHYYQSMLRRTLPMGLALVDQCHTDEVDAEKLTFQVPEFTQFCMLFFCASKDGMRWQDTWQRDRLKWWRKYACHPSHFTTSEVRSEGGIQSIDILYPFPWGEDVIERITNYGPELFDESKATKSSGKVHSVKVAGSLERGMLVFLCDAFHQRRVQGKTTLASVMKFHRKLCPYKLAILPETLNRELLEISSYLASNFRMIQGWNVLHVNKHNSNMLTETLRALPDRL